MHRRAPRHFSFQITLGLIGTLALTSCDHTDSYLVNATPTVGPINESSNQLTFNVGDDYLPRWSYDGRSVAYAYVEPGRANQSRCLGIVPAGGGTRIVTLCESRATHADSADSFAAPAIGPGGELLYLQATSKRGGIVHASITLWLADTASPLLSRRRLIKFPIPLADTTINWLSDIAWEDPQHILGLASTFGVSGRIGDPKFDTIFAPHFLIRGTLTASGLSLAKLPGTDSAIAWAFDPTGNVLFVRGSLQEVGGVALIVPKQTLYRVPPEGGVPEVVAVLPGVSGGIRSMSCFGSDCIISGGTIGTPLFYTYGLTNGVLTGRSDKINIRAPQIGAGGKFFVYTRQGNIFRDDFPVKP